MLDFFRGTLTAQTILDTLDHLPRTSAYHTAVSGDEDLAQQIAESDQKTPKREPPPLSAYSPEVEAIADLRDICLQMLRVLVKVNGGKPSPFKPYPRPETAVDKALRTAREQSRFKRHRALVKRLLPGRS